MAASVSPVVRSHGLQVAGESACQAYYWLAGRQVERLAGSRIVRLAGRKAGEQRSRSSEEGGSTRMGYKMFHARSKVSSWAEPA